MLLDLRWHERITDIGFREKEKCKNDYYLQI